MDHLKGLVHGEKGNQQAAPAPAPQQPQAAPGPAPAQSEHHNPIGSIGKKLGGAAIFGAGATAGSDAVNSLIN